MTHDAGIGASAERLIHMRDGRLVRDERRAAVAGPDGRHTLALDTGA